MKICFPPSLGAGQRLLRTASFLVATISLPVLALSTFARQFSDVSTEAGLIHLRTRAWGNPIWGDINNDGYLDLIVPVHELDYLGGPPTPFVYRNNQDGTFTDLAESSGLVQAEPDNGDWLGYSFGDYDGDGNLDVFIAEPPFQSGGGGQPVSNVPTRNILYKGNGDGTFTYASDTAGLEISRNYGECGFFFDYDNDGKLDLFVKNIETMQDPGTNVLYRNNGDGTYTQVPGAAGLADATHGVAEGTIVSFVDYDNDGDMDVVMGGNGTTEALYRNDAGTYLDVTSAAGITPRANALGLAWGDYDNDGFLDLYISRGKQSGLGLLNNTLYRNNADGTFTDVTSTAGIDDGTNTWAAVWGDYDNDGYLDLFVARPGTREIGPGNANLLYHNNGDGTFTDRAVEEGVALQDDEKTSAHKLAAFGDYNNDGFLDLVLQDGIAPTKVTGDAVSGYHFLFRNSGNSNHYIRLKLQGVQSNRDGIGARVTATYSNAIAFRENNGGGGGEYASQGASPLHFGIGAATSATLTVNWPSGVVDTLSDVTGNATLTLVEGSTAGAPPSITQEPRNATAAVGQTASFKVKATGTPPLGYQWFKNGVAIPGAVRPKYVTPPVTLDDNGSRFSVLVSNGSGSVKSRSARLAVTP